MPTLNVFSALVVALSYVLALGAYRLEARQKAATSSAAVSNPVEATATSVAAGKKLYNSNCVPCHGESGRGDGKMASQFDPKPANLVDAEWKHGSSDGDIFAVIRDGVKDTGMKAFGSKMTAREMWNVINYVRSLGAEAAK